MCSVVVIPQTHKPGDLQGWIGVDLLEIPSKAPIPNIRLGPAFFDDIQTYRKKHLMHIKCVETTGYMRLTSIPGCPGTVFLSTCDSRLTFLSTTNFWKIFCELIHMTFMTFLTPIS